MAKGVVANHAQSASARPDAQRIVAGAGTLLVHLLLLLALLGEPASVRLPPSRPITVRLIEDPRGQAAGPATNKSEARMPSAQQVPVKAISRGDARAVHASTRRIVSNAAPQVLVVSPIPPPAIETSRAPPDGLASRTATLAVAAGNAPGNAGSGRHGSDAEGSMRRITFLRRAMPTLPRSYRNQPVSAWVMLAVRIDESGRAREVRMMRSSGSAEIDFAVREAARKSVYVPHQRDGRPVAFWGLIPYTFGDVQPDIDAALASAGFEHT